MGEVLVLVEAADGSVKKVTTELLQGNPDINVIFASTGPGTSDAATGAG